MQRVIEGTAVVLLLLGLVACAHTTNENQALCADGGAAASSPGSCPYNPEFGYRFQPRNSDTLVVVTLSGGGIRASALAYGTLKALQELPSTHGDGDHLLDDVDIISSVSGGSVTAGWYALEGREGLADDKANRLLDFLREGGMGALAWRGLNPVSATRYLLTSYQRSDVLADFFADRLYGEATYAEVDERYKRKHQPFVILNATDLGHETRFPFTQNRFDLICSDLDRYRLADAVAASANFPIVFSPMGLNNYSRECAARRMAIDAWNKEGPPAWLKRYEACEAHPDDSAGVTATPARTNGLLELRAARDARDYIEPGKDDEVLHLVDGGLVDNLGVLSTLAIEDEARKAPGLFQRLRIPGWRPYDRIRNVLYIVVNARTRSPALIDDSTYPPGPVSSLRRVIDTPLDSTILGTQNYLTAELEAIEFPIYPDEGDNCTGAHSEVKPRHIFARIVAIDFEMIPNKRCRDAYWQLGTSWTLDRAAIDKLILLPKVMLRRSPELREFYGKSPALAAALEHFPADFSGVCADRPLPAVAAD